MNTDNNMVLPYMIAVDFDGTLVTDEYPKIGKIKEETWVKVEKARAKGAKIILWTCRNGKALEDAVEFCRDHGLEFDSVNENIKEVQKMFGGDTRKVYANEYWDDRAVQFGTTLAQTILSKDTEVHYETA